jgi:drug/metabolite transporter (DMT)-like permease
MSEPVIVMASHGRERQGALCLLAAMASFASVPLFLRYLTRFPDLLDAWTVNAVRYGMGLGFWLPYIIHRFRRFPGERRVWRAAIRVSLVSVTGQIGWALAAYHNEAGVIAFVVRSSFLFAVTYSLILLPAERATVRRIRFWVGATGMVGGIVLMFGNAFHTGKSSPLGLGILLFTAAVWGLYGVLVKRDLSGYDERASFGAILVYTTGVLVVMMFLFGDWRALAGVPPSLWLVLVCSVLAGIVFSDVLYYRGIHVMGPVIANGTSFIQPFLTALGAWLFLGEVLHLSQWLGGIVLVGSCLVLLSIKLGRQPGIPLPVGDTALPTPPAKSPGQGG